MDLIWEVLMAIPPKWQTFSMNKNQPLPFLDVIASAQTCKGSSKTSPQPHPPRSRTYPDATNTTPAVQKKTPTLRSILPEFGRWMSWIGLALKIVEVLRGIKRYSVFSNGAYTSQIGKGCPVLTSKNIPRLWVIRLENLRRSARESLPRCCLCTCWTWEGRGGIFLAGSKKNAEHVTCWFRIFGSCFGLQAYRKFIQCLGHWKCHTTTHQLHLIHSQRTP